MNIIKGNLIKLAEDGQFDVIIHGCNCFNVMGSGIAAQIKERFPEAHLADQETEVGDERKLGNISQATIIRGSTTFVVVNAYTQFRTARRYGEVVVDYPALKLCFEEIKRQFSGKKIAYPQIGCGLAGGDWNVVSSIIDQVLDGEDHYLVMYDAGR